VRRYAAVLRHGDFRRLWLGSTVSGIGDGMTFVALSWIVLARPDGTAQLGLLGVCHTAPVVIGGMFVGPLLDRFDKRAVLIADCLLRAAVVATIPLSDVEWLPFVVAAVYGLLKMVPLAGFPAAIPALVAEDELDTANALEMLSFSVAGVVGPAAAGLLIAVIGAPQVLLIDSASFLVFALAAALVRRPLRPIPRHREQPATLRGLRRDRVIVLTTVSFMAFNIAVGMLMVSAPWLAKNEFGSDASILGIMLAALAAGEFAGAALAGALRSHWSPVRAIGSVQAAAACAFLCMMSSRPVVVLGFFAIGLLSAPMTVWAQSLRMRRIPQELHGRAFAFLRTLMQATPPLGAALVTPLLLNGQVAVAALVMTALAGLPALLLLRRDRSLVY
jgi:MFS family permease